MARSSMRSTRAGDFDAAEVEYAAVGAGSYHWEVADRAATRRFVTVDDLDQKAWLGATRDATFDGLRRAFDTAVALHDGGLRFVVAPIPSRQGDSVRRLDPRYAIALFPFVEGEAGQFGWIVDDDERRAVVEMVAELHQATAAVGAGRTPGRPRSARPPSSRGSTPGARRAVVGWAALRAGAARGEGRRVRAGRVAHAGRPARRRGGASAEVSWVVTHGEPHAGNVMRTSEGRVLVDWDTVALAPPERDLWMLVAGGADAADLYARRRERNSTTLRSTSSASPGIWPTSPSTSTCFGRRTRRTTTASGGYRGPQGQRRDTEKLGGAARISTVAATLYRIQTNNLTISRLG